MLLTSNLKLLKIEELNNKDFHSKHMSELKDFYARVVLKKHSKYYSIPIESLKERSYLTYIIILGLNQIKLLGTMFFSSSRNRYLTRYHWIIQGINIYSRYIEEQEKKYYICTKCGFPVPGYSYHCNYCGTDNEEKWVEFEQQLNEVYDLDYQEEENVFEKAAEAILSLSQVISKIPPGKRKSDFCPGCGVAKEGAKCKYCGTQFWREY